MRILALEFSSDFRSIALVNAEQGDIQILAESHEIFTRSSPVGLIEQLLRPTAEVAGFQVDLVAIGLGPGSYTGIRSSISIAQGFELASGCKITGFSSMEILAAQLAWSGKTGYFHLIADAQKNEIYLQAFHLAEGRWVADGDLKIVPISFLEKIDPETVAGPEAKRFKQGALDFAPRASALARLAASQPRLVPGEKLEPIYLREISFVKAKPPRTWE